MQMEQVTAEKPATISFSLEEYQQRLARLRQLMREHDLDVMLVDQTEFMAYLTGFSVSENMYRVCLIPAQGEPKVIFRTIDMGPFLENSWVDPENAITFSDWEDPIEIVASVIKKQGWSNSNIGLDELSYNMPVRRFRQLTSLLPDAKFIDVSAQFQLLRTIKSPAEIRYLRRACEIADMAMDRLVTKATGQPISSYMAADVAHQVYMEHGAETSRAGIITTGEGNNFLHGNLHSALLQDGQVLHVELLPFYKGYSSRVMRPFVRGKHQEFINLAKQIIAIQDEQFTAMKPGKKACDIDAIARNGMQKAGLRADFPNITGYTVGYFPLSTPHTSDFTRVFSPNSQWLLEPGMTFHMYLSASGLAFSETVLVTETGMERLTKSSREIYIT